jgi:hypothetical protein
MTGQQIYDFIINTFKRTDKSDEVYEEILCTLLDLKQRFAWEDFKEESFTTSGISALGDHIIDLPSDFGHITTPIVMIDDSDSATTLIKINKNRYDELYPDAHSDDPATGYPKHFCIYKKSIYLGPPPSSTTYEYQINYTREDTTAITAATADVDFTPNYKEVIKAGVLYRMYFNLEDYDNAAMWKGQYEEGIKRAMSQENENTGAATLVEYTDI